MDDALEIERLKILIAQENKMLGLLEESCKELGGTVDELQGRYDAVEDESNEWKTRFEIQQEINDTFRRQIPQLLDKLEDSRNGVNRSGRGTYYDVHSGAEVTNYTLQMMERQKRNLQSQETEILGRVDQEAKAYYKADEQRRNNRLEMNAFSNNYRRFPESNRMTTNPHRSPHRSPPSQRRQGSYGTPRAPNEAIGNRNIPPDQRILDARRGPIKKTAAVKQLPSLGDDHGSRNSPEK